jgi:hypothetical protein
MWIGEHLKAKLRALHYDTLHCVDVLSEVIAPEVVAHSIARNVGIQYDEALNVLKDEAAWEYSGVIDNTPEAELYMQLLDSIKLNYYLGTANCGVCNWAGLVVT